MTTYTHIDSAAKDKTGFDGVAGFTPGAFTYQAHGAIAEAVHRQIAANKKGAAGRSGWSSHNISNAKAFRWRIEMLDSASWQQKYAPKMRRGGGPLRQGTGRGLLAYLEVHNRMHNP